MRASPSGPSRLQRYLTLPARGRQAGARRCLGKIVYNPPSEHLGGGLLLPHEEAEAVQFRQVAEDARLDVEGDVLQVAGVLVADPALRDRRAQFAVSVAAMSHW